MDKQDIIDGLDVILGRRGEKITQGDILIVEAAIMALAKAARPEAEAKMVWRDPEDKPPHLPDEHHSQDVLLCMKRRGGLFGGEQIVIGHVSLGNWRPRGGTGNFDNDILGWMPLPTPLPQPQSDAAHKEKS